MNKDKYYGLIDKYKILKSQYKKYKSTWRYKVDVFILRYNIKWAIRLLKPKDHYYKTVLAYYSRQIIAEMRRRRAVRKGEIKPSNTNKQRAKKKRR